MLMHKVIKCTYVLLILGSDFACNSFQKTNAAITVKSNYPLFVTCKDFIS